jgi:DNA-binding response OmpR family regulator
MDTATAKRRILLIDDEATFTFALKSYLEKTGRYEVRAENRAEKGLAAAKEFQPQFILLDVIMPDQDGGYVAEQLRQDERLRSVPVVFLTAVVSREETQSHAGGVIAGQQFLAKPVGGREVLAVIERHFNEAAPAAR